MYGWSMRRKPERFHEELRLLEDDLAGPAAQDIASALTRLDRIEQQANQANQLRLQTAYASMH
jgi:hypothetical protein